MIWTSLAFEGGRSDRFDAIVVEKNICSFAHHSPEMDDVYIP